MVTNLCKGGQVLVLSLKAMIVDDQMGIRRLLVEYLQHEGWRTMEAKNGLEAIELLTEEPDIILLDIKMPVMDGIEALKIVRQQYPDLPVIVMTAYGELEIINQAELLGISARVAKPFDIEALVDMMNRFCTERAIS